MARPDLPNFLVWRSGRSAPAAVADRESVAIQLAQRVARRHPGEDVYVCTMRPEHVMQAATTVFHEPVVPDCDDAALR